MMAERGLWMAHTTMIAGRSATRRSSRNAGVALPGRRSVMAGRRDILQDPRQVVLPGSCRCRAGRTVDVRLTAKRDVAAAQAFFCKAIKGQQRCLQTIALDGYAASHRAVCRLKADGSLPADAKLRSPRYLNNLIEQDHRGVKQRIAVVLASSCCTASGRDSSD